MREGLLPSPCRGYLWGHRRATDLTPHQSLPLAPTDGPEEVTHRCPPAGSSVMPCCGRTPFEVPPYHRMTLDDALVTCAVACNSNPPESGSSLQRYDGDDRG